MFDNDLLVAFGVMAILFLRQIVILKQPNKINYAPLMIGIGAISSIVHFMIYSDATDVVLLIRESFFPLLVAFILFIIMNILHQTQQSIYAKTQERFTTVLVKEISQLKSFIVELEKRMDISQKNSIQTQEEIRKQFVDDIKALDTIEANQKHFLEKLAHVEKWQDELKKSLEYFSKEQLPQLDDVVHKHIDILRISEQDHYNKLQDLLKKALQSRFEIADDIQELNAKIDSLKGVAKGASNTIVKESTQKLTAIIKDFENEIVLLKSNAGVMLTSLSEGETTLLNIRTQSELIMKQMVLSSKKMDELAQKNNAIKDVFSEVKVLLDDVEAVKSDYVKSQSQLFQLTKELKANSDEEINTIALKLNELSFEISQKIEKSLQDLHQHYHIVGDDVSKKANLLAKKAQVKKGYTDLEN